MFDDVAAQKCPLHVEEFGIRAGRLDCFPCGERKLPVFTVRPPRQPSVIYVAQRNKRNGAPRGILGFVAFQGENNNNISFSSKEPRRTNAVCRLQRLLITWSLVRSQRGQPSQSKRCVILEISVRVFGPFLGHELSPCLPL